MVADIWSGTLRSNPRARRHAAGGDATTATGSRRRAIVQAPSPDRHSVSHARRAARRAALIRSLHRIPDRTSPILHSRAAGSAASTVHAEEDSKTGCDEFAPARSEEHTSELQSLMSNSY